VSGVAHEIGTDANVRADFSLSAGASLTRRRRRERRRWLFGAGPIADRRRNASRCLQSWCQDAGPDHSAGDQDAVMKGYQDTSSAPRPPPVDRVLFRSRHSAAIGRLARPSFGVARMALSSIG